MLLNGDVDGASGALASSATLFAAKRDLVSAGRIRKRLAALPTIPQEASAPLELDTTGP
jgi:hypothetical protein